MKDKIYCEFLAKPLRDKGRKMNVLCCVVFDL